MKHRQRQLFHLIGQHGSTIDLHHIECTVHMVQQVDAGLQPRVLPFDVILQRDARLTHRLVKLTADPSQRTAIVLHLGHHDETTFAPSQPSRLRPAA